MEPDREGDRLLFDYIGVYSSTTFTLWVTFFYIKQFQHYIFEN